MSHFPVSAMTKARAALLLLALLARAARAGGEPAPPAGGDQVLPAGGEQAHPVREPTCPDGQHEYQIQTKEKKVVIRPGPDGNSVAVKCEGNGILEALEAPKDSAVLCPTQPTAIHLMNCSLAGGSLKEVLAKLNVSVESLQHLELRDLPPGSTLREDLFLGLGHLLRLKLTTPQSSSNTIISRSGLLGPLHKLQELEIQSVPLQPEELNNLAKTLRKLSLLHTGVDRLPRDWLKNCSLLQTLNVSGAENLTYLPDTMFADSSAIESITFQNCGLETFPETLLNNLTKLNNVTLSGNRLTMLPRSMFSGASGLTRLDLSRNLLGEDSVLALADLTNLTWLSLGSNPLGDLCSKNTEKSLLGKLTQLKRLFLSNTRVSRMCADWRRHFTRLGILDLRNTRIRELWSEDLMFDRDVDMEEPIVFLENNSITSVRMSIDDYKNAKSPSNNKPTFNKITVQLDDNLSLACDCYMFWTRLALDLSSKPFKHVPQLSSSKCKNETLKQTDPDDMLCSNDGYHQQCSEEVSDKCKCGFRPENNTDSETATWRVRLDCSNHGPADYSPLPPADGSRRYELLLQHNHISELPADALRADIVKLDLSFNGLMTANETTVKKLYDFTGMLRLTGNKLDCSCSNAPLLAVLAWRLKEQRDLLSFAAECEDGSSLLSAPAGGCAPRNATWLAAALAVLFALAMAAVAFLWSRERRFFFKAVLHRWGLWRPAAAAADDDRPYDAFVTFSHKDEARVLELVARLEPPYRLCVHYRDWVPGRYITEQIAESVAGSRRTIALVSRHFLESGWALAEFRQAHAAAMLESRPRLVVVLLEDPAALRLDSQLRRYLATNTYVRWGDPWLWDKLALALPRPRASPAATDATVPDPCPTMTTKAPDPAPAAVTSRSSTVALRRAEAALGSSRTHSLTSTENSTLSSPVVTSSRPALRRSPTDTVVILASGNAAVSSSGVSELSASTAELELTPLCLAPPAESNPEPAQGRLPLARERQIS